MSRAASQAGAFVRAVGTGPLPLERPGSRAAAEAFRGSGAYALFVLVNAALFVRPSEIVPALEGWPIYAVIATLALAAALPAVLPQLGWAALAERPITVCVIAMLFAVVLSHLTVPFLWGARLAGVEFFKVLLYYLLLVAVVDNPGRLRRLLSWLVALGVVVTLLALLQYHEWIDIPALTEIEHGYTDPETGERLVVMRLVSTGIYNDPNDLCLFLILTMAACVHRLEEPRWGAARFLWMLPLTMFSYALTLTHSRGGFLGLLAAIVVFIWARFGWRKGLPMASLALPVMFFLFAGRQTEIDVDHGTAQERIQLWSEGLTLFRGAPVFGIGYGEFVERIDKVAHNSFLHAFAELGFFGGTVFLGAFALAFRSVHRVGRAGAAVDAELLVLRPYVLAIVAGYAVGMLSISRAYVVPTYLVLGVAAAYVEIVRRRSPAVGRALPRVGTRLALRLGALSAGFLACTYVFVRLFARWD